MFNLIRCRRLAKICLTKRLLEVLSDGVFTISLGRLFHSFMTRSAKEFALGDLTAWFLNTL